VFLSYRGGGTAADAARNPPELAEAYPEPSMFGVLPAWALWARHVDGLRLDGFVAETESPDARPPFVFENVSGLAVTRTPLWPKR
jgi:hypothetical protein